MVRLVGLVSAGLVRLAVSETAGGGLGRGGLSRQSQRWGTASDDGNHQRETRFSSLLCELGRCSHVLPDDIILRNGLYRNQPPGGGHDRIHVSKNNNKNNKSHVQAYKETFCRLTSSRGNKHTCRWPFILQIGSSSQRLWPVSRPR